ncbi:MAG TPA: hypothetical protein VIK22_01900 [Candidatus Anoxymicrobiaceae bacterium]
MKVGVTGHRILMDIDKITAGLNTALQEIMVAFGGEPPTVLTSLAEGADRLVAEAALGIPGSRIVAVIPFELADYVTDFGAEGSESRKEFDRLLDKADEVVQLPDAPTRNEGYESGGNYVVDNCDVLVAVWDGEGAQGQGGTGEIIERARSQGKPVVIVRAGNRKPGTSEPTTLGDEQGRVILEGLK